MVQRLEAVMVTARTELTVMISEKSTIIPEMTALLTNCC